MKPFEKKNIEDDSSESVFDLEDRESIEESKNIQLRKQIRGTNEIKRLFDSRYLFDYLYDVPQKVLSPTKEKTIQIKIKRDRFKKEEVTYDLNKQSPKSFDNVSEISPFFESFKEKIEKGSDISSNFLNLKEQKPDILKEFDKDVKSSIINTSETFLKSSKAKKLNKQVEDFWKKKQNFVCEAPVQVVNLNKHLTEVFL